MWALMCSDKCFPPHFNSVAGNSVLQCFKRKNQSMVNTTLRVLLCCWRFFEGVCAGMFTNSPDLHFIIDKLPSHHQASLWHQ